MEQSLRNCTAQAAGQRAAGGAGLFSRRRPDQDHSVCNPKLSHFKSSIFHLMVSTCNLFSSTAHEVAVPAGAASRRSDYTAHPGNTGGTSLSSEDLRGLGLATVQGRKAMRRRRLF